jgi:hypothetical protein
MQSVVTLTNLTVSDIALTIGALCSVCALFVSILNMLRIQQVHVLFNSRMTELLLLTKTASFAEGQKEQRDGNIGSGLKPSDNGLP